MTKMGQSTVWVKMDTWEVSLQDYDIVTFYFPAFQLPTEDPANVKHAADEAEFYKRQW